MNQRSTATTATNRRTLGLLLLLEQLYSKKEQTKNKKK